jgi:hypothetical protein
MTIKTDNQLVILGETNFRNQRWRFGIKKDDRRRHMYVVGSTGMGKTEFLKNMAIQDIEAGRGVAYIDPHGDASDELLDYIPAERIKDVIYFDPGDLNFPIAFNVMEKVNYEFRHLVASGLSGVFKKIFGVEVFSGRMEYILNNTILALLEYPGATLLGINRMLSNKDYRKKVVENITDPIVKSFWVDEFAKYTDRYMQEATPAIQNKIGQFISNNLIRNVIGQVHSTIDVRKIMDEGKILIVNLSRGKIGEDASRLLGALLITKIQLASMSRVDIPEKDRRDFYLYVDEFQHFATESFANILSEARKYHLSLVVAHQYIKQMEEEVRDAVFGNVGTIISFRVGAEDGEFLEKWFQPDFLMNDIVNLGKYNIYLKLMIDGVSSKGFSAQTVPPFPKLTTSNRDAVIDHSRKTYATSREEVEKKIAEWAGGFVQETAAPPPTSYRSPENYSQRSMPASRPQPIQQQPKPSLDSFSRQPMQDTRSMERGPERERWPSEGRGSDDRRQNPQYQPRPQQDRYQSDQGHSRPNYDRPPQNNDRPQARPFFPKSPAREVSLSDALKTGPVNFSGRKMEGKKDKPKAEVNTNELRKALEEAMKGSGE